MKKFISVFLALTMIFTSLGVLNVNAATLNDMYIDYKYLISSFSSSFRKIVNNPESLTYSLYDIDKDNSAELILIGRGYNSNARYEYRLANVYTFKNGKAQLCGSFSSDSMYAYHTVVGDQYGNGFGVYRGTGAGWECTLYVLKGTQLVATQQTLLYDSDPTVRDYVYFLNGKKLSNEAAKNFPDIPSSNTNNLSYLKKYFKM